MYRTCVRTVCAATASIFQHQAVCFKGCNRGRPPPQALPQLDHVNSEAACVAAAARAVPAHQRAPRGHWHSATTTLANGAETHAHTHTCSHTATLHQHKCHAVVLCVAKSCTDERVRIKEKLQWKRILFTSVCFCCLFILIIKGKCTQVQNEWRLIDIQRSAPHSIWLINKFLAKIQITGIIPVTAPQMLSFSIHAQYDQEPDNPSFLFFQLINQFLNSLLHGWCNPHVELPCSSAFEVALIDFETFAGGATGSDPHCHLVMANMLTECLLFTLGATLASCSCQADTWRSNVYPLLLPPHSPSASETFSALTAWQQSSGERRSRDGGEEVIFGEMLLSFDHPSEWMHDEWFLMESVFHSLQRIKSTFWVTFRFCLWRPQSSSRLIILISTQQHSN